MIGEIRDDEREIGGMRLRPDWVMVGYRVDAQHVRILASQELTAGELRAYERLRRDALDSSMPIDMTSELRYTVTASMKRFVIIDVPTYTQAFEGLFRYWLGAAR